MTELPDQLSAKSVQNFPMAMVLTDPHRDDNPIVYVNDRFCRITGYERSAVLGRNCRFLQGGRTSKEAVRDISIAIKKEEEVTVDLLNYRADGSEFVNRLLISPLFNDDGGVSHFVGVQSVYEGSDSEAAEVIELGERLAELQHRVKNHLTMILSLVRLTANEAGAIDIIAPRVEAIGALYDQLSATGDEDVALGAYVGRVASAMQGLSNRVAVRVDVRTATARASADDAARVGLIPSEVLTNALQHGFGERDQGSVEVVLTDGAGPFTLTVRDDGKGLGDAVWPDRNSLGGRIVLDLADRLGGRLEVNSSADGTLVTLAWGHDEGEP